MKYAIIDTPNLYWRGRYVVKGDSIDERIGMCMHIMLSSMHKVFKDFQVDHMVICFDGKSWRKEIYDPYKRNRHKAKELVTEKDVEEDKMFYESFKDLRTFLDENTNVTVLNDDKCEADDFIARWIQNHSNDEHIIVSSDSDFYQLLNENVSQYNGITNQLITLDGIFDEAGNLVIDKKTNKPKVVEDPEWLLFEKCIRGDVSDNIFSAYPGARKKGTKSRVGMQEAFNDRHKQGFDWTNFMLQRWTDHEGNEHVVNNDYNRNKMLIDLTAQPDDIKEDMDQVIIESVQKKPIKQVGIRFMKFCGKYGLERIGSQSQEYSKFLSKGY